MSYNSIVVALSSLKPFFFNGLKKELCFSDRLLLDSRVVGFADVLQLNCCRPFLLEALLFQWP